VKKNEFNPPLINNYFTIRDYQNMTFEELIEHDKRTFWGYYWEKLLTSHQILQSFFFKSLVSPQTIRVLTFFLEVSFAFALNAIFYSDSYIQNINTTNVSSTSTNTFSYTVSNQLAKSIWSILIGTVPIVLLKILATVPDRMYNKFNHALLTVEADKVEEANNILWRHMKWRYAAFFVLGLLLHLLAWYYVTVFCGVYIKSSVSWVCGGIISLIIKYIIVQPLLPFVLALLRLLAIKFTKNKCACLGYRLIAKLKI